MKNTLKMTGTNLWGVFVGEEKIGFVYDQGGDKISRWKAILDDGEELPNGFLSKEGAADAIEERWNEKIHSRQKPKNKKLEALGGKFGFQGFFFGQK